MSNQINTDTTIDEFTKIYNEQFQKNAIAAWNLSIYLTENRTDLSSLPEPVRESLEFMTNCRRIVQYQSKADIAASIKLETEEKNNSN